MLVTISSYNTENISYDVMKKDISNSFLTHKTQIQESTNELINLISNRDTEINSILLYLESKFINKDCNIQIFLSQKEEFIIVYY